MFPRPLQNLISQFERLPGVGPKTAERYVLHILKKDKLLLSAFILALQEVKARITVCQRCHAPDISDPCRICADTHRNDMELCIVAEYQDLLALENTGAYHGQYHVLGGTLNALEGKTRKNLHIESLVRRIQEKRPQEIIIAISPSVEGEVTVLYLQRLLKQLPIKLTRLAQGLPMGSHIEFADEVTITKAMQARYQI